jgi:hypothetical protein
MYEDEGADGATAPAGIGLEPGRNVEEAEARHKKSLVASHKSQVASRKSLVMCDESRAAKITRDS